MKNPLSFPAGGNPIKGSGRRPPGVPGRVWASTPSGDWGGFIWFPLISINNKVYMFIIFAPKLVLEKNIHSAFGEMSGRAQDPLLHEKFSGPGVQNQGGGGSAPRGPVGRPAGVLSQQCPC